MWCDVTKNVISPFLFEESMVIGEKIPPMMEDTALLHIPAGTVFQLYSAPSHFSSHVRAFLDREFSDPWIEKEGPSSLAPSFSDITHLDFFFLGFVKDTVS
jgi:hypothetical protein